MNDLSFLEAIYVTLVFNLSDMLQNALPYVLGGRILVYLCILYQFLVMKPNNEALQKIAYVREVFKEIVLISAGSLYRPLAISIAAYSILTVGRMLVEIGDITGKNLVTNIAIFFQVALVPFSLSLLIVISFIGENLFLEALGIAFALIYSLIQRRTARPPLFSKNYFAAKAQAMEKIPLLAQTLFLILLVAIPSTLLLLVHRDKGIIHENHMIPMSDGVRLSTDVYYRRETAANFPTNTLLIRTPYNTQSEGSKMFAYMHALLDDYVVVIQDSRGRFASEGIDPVFFMDSSDGVDTVNWILDQPWSNGKIATDGGSALGIAQYFMHAEEPEGVGAAQIMVGTPEFYDHVAYQGGALRLGLIKNWLTAQDSLFRFYELLEQPIKNESWANVSLLMNNRYENVNVRAVHVGGWYDCFSQGTIDGFKLYNNGTDYARNHQILVMGPWTHGLGTRYQGELLYPENAAGMHYADYARELIFGEYFHGATVNWDEEPRVYYYVMGNPESDDPRVNEWRNATDWPINTGEDAWYFHPNGTLSLDMPNSDANMSYIFDPTDPVLNRGGNTLTLEHMGPYDQRPVHEDRTDILEFTSEELTEAYEVIGNIQASLLVSSNCTDTDFTVKLMDVYPDGREMLIADGILRARRREGFHLDAFLEPGEVYEIDVDLWSTAYRFLPGHQIKVVISSSNYPRFAVNDNLGGPIREDVGENFNYANNTILLRYAEQASSLLMQVE